MKYFDRNGTEITDGCCIQLPNGCVREVAAIDDPLYPLGYDSTRQSWLDSGRAYPGQLGYYALHPTIAIESVVVERPAHWKEA